VNWVEAARAGSREIATNKVRSVLSFSAIAVGVGSLLYTLAQTRGMKQELKKTMDLMGPGRITVEGKRDYVSKGLSRGLTADDAEAIAAELPGLYMIYPKADGGARLRYGRDGVDVGIQGVTPDWRKRDWVFTLRGRFLNRRDVEQGARVCVLRAPGGWLKKPFWAMYWSWENPFDAFMARHEPLGRQVLLGEHVFTVVGVLQSPPRDRDPRWFSWEDPDVLVPVTAYHRYLAGEGSEAPRRVREIKLDTGDEKTVASVKTRIAALLKRRHRGEEDFEVKDMREEIEQEMSQSGKYTMAAMVLGGVAIFAGGIGIMNVTLATIFSRIKEIGVRRALGASRSDILAQFVVEAALLGAAGGIAGIGLGLSGIWYLKNNTDRELASMAWQHAVLAVGAAGLVSAAFALLPAYQAAKLDPVEALRSES
jgi:putative ABC transport system permease protein